MTTRRKMARAAMALLLAPGAFIWAQDLTFKARTEATGDLAASRGSGERTSTTYVSRDALRTSGAGMDFLLFSKDRRVVLVDNNNRTYTSIQLDEVEALMKNAPSVPGHAPMPIVIPINGAAAIGGAAGNAAVSVVADLISWAMARRIKRYIPGDPSLKDGGPGGVILGFETHKYVLTVPRAMQAEMWVAPEFEPPFGQSWSGQARSGGGSANPFTAPFEKAQDLLTGIKGWPLKQILTIEMVDLKGKLTSEIFAVEKGPIPPSTFEIPAGYLKKDLPGFPK